MLRFFIHSRELIEFFSLFLFLFLRLFSFYFLLLFDSPTPAPQQWDLFQFLRAHIVDAQQKDNSDDADDNKN